jgi:hypothetical protein
MCSSRVWPISTPRRLLLVSAFLLLPTLTIAQTATSTLFWDYLNTPAATAQSYTHAVTVDGVAQTGAVVCAPAPVSSTSTCRLPISGGPLARGAHTVTVSAVENGVEQITQTTIDTSKGPTPQGNVRVSVTVVVTIP